MGVIAVTNTTEATVARVIEQYHKSGDFNGLPATTLVREFSISETDLKQELKSLIQDETLAISLYVNPHIRAFDDSVERQIAALEASPLDALVLYPTLATLAPRVKKLENYHDRPFSRMLFEGYPQLYQCYFELPVLERT